MGGSCFNFSGSLENFALKFAATILSTKKTKKNWQGGDSRPLAFNRFGVGLSSVVAKVPRKPKNNWTTYRHLHSWKKFILFSKSFFCVSAGLCKLHWVWFLCSSKVSSWTNKEATLGLRLLELVGLPCLCRAPHHQQRPCLSLATQTKYCLHWQHRDFLLFFFLLT